MRFIGLGVVLAMLTLAGSANAQWSLGAPGPRTASSPDHRYAFLVFANPMPGREAEFNEWYDYEHLGDLIQLSGWEGAQRFRLVSDIEPKPTRDGYRWGYLALWDQEAASADGPRASLDAAQDGGKARRSRTFEYRDGASPKALYEVAAARRVRGDGLGFSIPAAADTAGVRPNRYLLIDYSDPPEGVAADDYRRLLDDRIARVLTTPGWIAAQRFEARATPGSRGAADVASPFPAEMILWEVEAL